MLSPTPWPLAGQPLLNRERTKGPCNSHITCIHRLFRPPVWKTETPHHGMWQSAVHQRRLQEMVAGILVALRWPCDFAKFQTETWLAVILEYERWTTQEEDTDPRFFACMLTHIHIIHAQPSENAQGKSGGQIPRWHLQPWLNIKSPRGALEVLLPQDAPDQPSQNHVKTPSDFNVWAGLRIVARKFHLPTLVLRLNFQTGIKLKIPGKCPGCWPEIQQTHLNTNYGTRLSVKIWGVPQDLTS